jgi:UDP-2,4-diacetamido-2,4,6-trideoxy-beta-L-altropyranose hydrolase
MTVGIRVEAGKDIATGHLMRCLAISREFEHIGLDVVFLYKFPSTRIMLDQFKIRHFRLCNSFVSFLDEVDYVKNALESLQINLIIVDGYSFSFEYLSLLKNITTVCSIDDFCREENPADVIINYNIYAIGKYSQYRPNKGRRILLGPSYAPLREEFQHVIPREPPRVVADILVTTGGKDPYDFIGKFLSEVIAMKDFNCIRFHAVIGSLVWETDKLKELSRYKNVILYRDVQSMSSIMVGCDIAVSAGGSTLYELCRCGLPTVSISFADNQLPAVKEFHERGIIPYCGDLRTDIQATIRQCISCLQYYINDYPQRLKISHDMSALVDGRGASRIATELKSLLAERN